MLIKTVHFAYINVMLIFTEVIKFLSNEYGTMKRPYSVLHSY